MSAMTWVPKSLFPLGRICPLRVAVFSSIVLGVFVSGLSVAAQEPTRPLRFERPPPPPRMNEIEIATRYLLAPDISVLGLGTIPFRAFEVPETNLAIGVEREIRYDDGFIRQDYSVVDVIGGDGVPELIPTPPEDGRSSNFGYFSEAQLRFTDGEPTGVAFRRYESAPAEGVFTHEIDSSGSAGWEIRYRRFIDTSARFAMQVGFGFNGFDSSFDQSIEADVRFMEDVYALAGIDLEFPEEGGFQGARVRRGDSSLISWSPEDSITGVLDGPQTVRSTVDFRSSIVSLRAGPTYDLDVFDRLSLNFGAGVAAGLYSSKFSVFETMELESVIMMPARERVVTSDQDLFYAGYIDAGASYRFNPRVRFFSSVQYQGAGGDHTHRGADERTVEVDLDQQIFVNAGFGVRF